LCIVATLSKWTFGELKAMKSKMTIGKEFVSVSLFKMKVVIKAL